MTSNNQDTKITLSEIIAPGFHDLYKQYKEGNITELWCKGGRGSTKSTFISILIFLILQKDARANAFLSVRYQNELRDTVFGQMQWTAAKMGLSHIWKFSVSPMQAEHVQTGQKILFRGADNPLKAKSIKLKKGFIKIFWGEEIDRFGGMEEIRNLLQSLFRGEGDGWISLFSFNPPKSQRSWVNAETKISKPGRVVHHSDYTTVPRDWLGERFIAEAEHLKTVNENAYKHEYLGEEVGTGLEVFNNVTLKTITKEEKDTFGDTDQGLDFGYAVDPLAFEKSYYNPKKRILYIFDEIAGIGLSNRKFAEKLPIEYKAQMTIADNAEPKSINELHSDYGLRIRGCRKGPGSVEFGIKWLQDLEAIIIDPGACPMAAKEFYNYSLDVNKAGETISKFPDKDNHAIDAIRYGNQNNMIAAKPVYNAGKVSARKFGL